MTDSLELRSTSICLTENEDIIILIILDSQPSNEMCRTMQLDRENQQGRDHDLCICLILVVYLKTFRNNQRFEFPKVS